jgi:hypothetical protein
MTQLWAFTGVSPNALLPKKPPLPYLRQQQQPACLDKFSQSHFGDSDIVT